MDLPPGRPTSYSWYRPSRSRTLAVPTVRPGTAAALLALLLAIIAAAVFQLLQVGS